MKTSVNDANPKVCPSCGKPLPAGAPAGLCPACLLAQGMQTDAEISGGTTRFVPPPLDEITQLFPQLEVMSLLGAGGMGAVYKARQPALDRMVALKILPANPELLFDREWALALLDQVVARLSQECERDGKAALFEHAKAFLTVGSDTLPYASAAAAAGLDEGAMRVAVHRLRKRYRELLREEITQTLADPTRMEEEMRSLMAALAA
jgi:hypothetical protein